MRKNFLPLIIRLKLRDLVQTLRWYTPPPAKDSNRYNLSKTQFYPEGSNFTKIIEECYSQTLSALELTKKTPIVSLGSCFAEEFTKQMKGQGFNYIFTEEHAKHASANWGRVYTIPNFLQIVKYSYDTSYPMHVVQDSNGWFDATRERAVGLYATSEEAVRAIKAHRYSSRNAFDSASVLVVTLGQNEAWVNSEEGLTYAEFPRNDNPNLDYSRIHPIKFTFDQNLNSLRSALEILFKENETLKIILTVSPVHAYAIFSDRDAIGSSFVGKCTLRLVVDEILKAYPNKVFYFPSFEIVMGINRDALSADNRHVKSMRIKLIFDTFFNILNGNHKKSK